MWSFIPLAHRSLPTSWVIFTSDFLPPSLVVVIQSLSRIRLLAAPRTAARQASLSIAITRSLAEPPNGYPLQRSCPEDPMVRGAWWATVQGVARRRTSLSTHSLTLLHCRQILYRLRKRENPAYLLYHVAKYRETRSQTVPRRAEVGGLLKRLVTPLLVRMGPLSKTPRRCPNSASR